eukprot:TRINITY_DN47572_c0_g1_i1.p1 TRINITY_DN47572_c0_g1~~TRINITY_DN47572_c0_g1_i1.p1  ORF type:complete len:712 (-),score=140.29 TRINITY_DN47572_c0_g1_i1:19-2154(-)
MGCGKSTSADADLKNEVARLRRENEKLRQQMKQPTSAATEDVDEDFFLNTVLTFLWPHISDSAVQFIVENVEPAVRKAIENLPAPFNSCSIDRSRSHLGKKPLRLLAPSVQAAAAPDACSDLIVRVPLQWEGDGSVYLQFTGATLGIVDVAMHGDFFVELLGIPQANVLRVKKVSMLRGVRFFFANPPEIKFKIARGMLAKAVNERSLAQALFAAVSAQLGNSLVLPNSKSLTLAREADITSIHLPRCEGLLLLNVGQVKGYIAEASASANSAGIQLEITLGSETLRAHSQFLDPGHTFQFQVPLLVWRASHQRVNFKLTNEHKMTSKSRTAFASVLISDMVLNFQEEPLELQSGDAKGGMSIVMLGSEWRPATKPVDLPTGSSAIGVLQLGLRSACHVPSFVVGTCFWVSVFCSSQVRGESLTPKCSAEVCPSKEGDRLAESNILQKKIELLKKYDVSQADAAEILELDSSRLAEGVSDLAMLKSQKLEWNDAFEFLIQPMNKAVVTLEFWCKTPGNTKKMLGSCSVGSSEVVQDCMQLLKLEGTGVLLEVCFRLQGFGLLDVSQDLSLLKSDSIACEEEAFDLGEAVGRGLTTAVDGIGAGAAAVGGVVDGGVRAAVGGIGTAAEGLAPGFAAVGGAVDDGIRAAVGGIGSVGEVVVGSAGDFTSKAFSAVGGLFSGDSARDASEKDYELGTQEPPPAAVGASLPGNKF